MSQSPILRVRFSLSYSLKWYLFWYDCFLGKPLDLQSIVTGWRKPCLTHVHYRVFPIRYFKLSDKQDLCRFCGWENIIFPTPPFPHSDLPRSSEELKNWMIRLYQVILVLVVFFKEYSWHFELQEKEELLGTFYRTGEVQKHLGYPESRHVVFDEN